MKTKILIILILFLLLLTVTIINIKDCHKITSGYYVGRTVCYFGKVTINPGTTTIIDGIINT